jgi:two-component sensor histidine kinase
LKSTPYPRQWPRSELATNAVLHAGLSSRDKIFVTLSQNRDRVLVEVEDRGRGFVREHLADLASPVGYGLGLQIVGALAERWDTQPARGVVWAEVRLAGA